MIRDETRPSRTHSHGHCLVSRLVIFIKGQKHVPIALLLRSETAWEWGSRAPKRSNLARMVRGRRCSPLGQLKLPWHIQLKLWEISFSMGKLGLRNDVNITPSNFVGFVANWLRDYGHGFFFFSSIFILRIQTRLRSRSWSRPWSTVTVTAY